MKPKKLKSDRSLRPKLHSPGRPPVLHRAERWPFWKAIAQGHPFVYTPGNEPTTGATSLWYPLLLVPAHLVGADPSVAVAWSFGLGVLFYFLTALLATRLATTLGGWPAGPAAAAFVLASPHVLWGSLSGMEIGLYKPDLITATLHEVEPFSLI